MIRTTRSHPLPTDSLLARHCEGVRGAYTDAFVTEVPGDVSLPAFVEAFYSSLAFKPWMAASATPSILPLAMVLSALAKPNAASKS